jgi:hypothetical protein
LNRLVNTGKGYEASMAYITTELEVMSSDAVGICRKLTAYRRPKPKYMGNKHPLSTIV